MAGRRTKPEANRHGWHSANVEAAETPKSRLWAYCHWLVAEAWAAGPEQLNRTTDLIQNHINDLIEARKAGAR